MKNKKLLSLVTVAVIFSSLFGVFSFAPKAMAQGPTIEVSSIWQMAKDVIRMAAIQALSSGADYFARKMAYDLAMFTATGGKGQGPLAYNTNFGTYLKDTADGAAGVAIQSFTKEVVSETLGEKAANGLDICNIPDLKVDLALKIGYSFKYGKEPLPPKCTFTQLKENWAGEGFKSRFLAPGAVKKMFNLSLSAQDSNDFGIALQGKEKIDRIIKEQVAAKKSEREEGKGYKAVQGLIDGAIKTPAGNVAKDAIEGNSVSEAIKKTEAKANAAIASSEPATIISTYASIFINTLAGQIYKNYKECGVLVGTCPGLGENAGNGAADFAGAGSRASGRASAASIFGKLLVSPIRQLDQYDILSKYSSCSNPNNPGPEECIMDQKMVSALQQSSQGNLMTIGEAVEKGILDGTKKLISPDNLLTYDSNYCWTQGYCLSNVKKMRKARILPLGFEIAVIKSNPDRPWLLQDVLDGYNDPTKPYYHLIDPNWVLKIPEARCEALGYGTSLNPDISTRIEECVDLTSCVGYTKDGTCRDYAYCAREKNVWKFDAEECDAQYESCRSFTDNKGKNVSYLYKTLNTKSCNQNNAGCASYSLTRDNNGVWQSSAGSNVTDNNVNITAKLNGKLSTNCSANSDGCSAFKPAGELDDTYLMLRKAPSYFNCYDTNVNNNIPDEWPQTRADLALMRPKEECKNYAQVCLPDEVSCNWYKPTTYQGADIPGKFRPAEVVNNVITNWNDQCDAKCVGYSSYKEMPSNYANGNDLAYIIPSSGRTCTAEEEGCTSFTNLSITSGGMAQTEYFSYLRPCIKPEEGSYKNYITYEGSVVGGFQLKTYTLESDTDGSPKYFYRIDDDLDAYDNQCSEDLYRNGLSSADCREFSDEQGNTYYKLLSKTIAVSDQCTPYRLNTTELYADNTCFSNGDYRDGFCYYNGLPAGANNNAGVSKSCSASVNTCRAYKGNTGNNIRIVFSDSFEGSPEEALKDWESLNNSGTISQSAESIRTGEHSLLYIGNAGVHKILSLTPGKSYDLTFWAKGEPQDMTVSLEDNSNNSNNSKVIFGTVGLGDNWRSYHLGPKELSGATEIKLLFKSNLSGKRIFLDNVELKEMTDNIYLVKDSLSVDPVCDSYPDDNLPGEALGCAEYKDPNNTSFYLTNFSYLCRASAVGCTALIDTKNTLDTEKEKSYNIWLKAPVVDANRAEISLGGEVFDCQIPRGDTGCYVNLVGFSKSEIENAGGEFNESSIFLEADTPTTTPIYLVAEKKTSCNKVDLGCMLAGAEITTPTGESEFIDTVIKNDPALYDGFDSILCQNEAVGCKKWNSNKGESYFKDPILTGQKICEFKTSVNKNGQEFDGWFWKGVGVCENNTNKKCSNDSECDTDVSCVGIGEQACYPNYLVNGNFFDIYSFGDKGKYDNFVGSCPAEQNNCSQFVDRADNDKSYYYIDDDRVGSGDCGGEVSQKAGCVLLDKIGNPNKYYKTSDTYALSESQNSEKVSPVKAENTPEVSDVNDANVIVKVQRDRECGEWLKCRDSHPVYDEKLGKWKTVCFSLGLCENLTTIGESGGASACKNWTDSEFKNEVLNDSIYQNRRDTSWKGMDFSGYSLLNLYPLEELEQVNVSSTGKDWRLVKRIPCGGNGEDSIVSKGVDPGVCAFSSTQNVSCSLEKQRRSPVTQKIFYVTTDGSECGIVGNEGVCMNGNCIKNPNGESAITEIRKTAPNHECRAYPEKDSPFPNTKGIREALNITGLQEFSSVPVCSGVNNISEPTSDLSDPNALACECDYTKTEYGRSLNKYFGVEALNDTPIGICNSGIKDGEIMTGKVCDTNIDCGDVVSNPDDNPGICQIRSKTSSFVGWRGFCLEEDPAKILNADRKKHPCLTWLPIDYLIGAPDINGQHVEAGFVPPEDVDDFEPYYCLSANLYERNLSEFNSSAVEGWDLKNARDPILFAGVGASQIPLKKCMYDLNLSGDDQKNCMIATVAFNPAGAVFLNNYFNALKTENVGNYEMYKCPSVEGYTAQFKTDADGNWIKGPNYEVHYESGDGWFECHYTQIDRNAPRKFSLASGTPDPNREAVIACENLVSVADGLNTKAWTDRMWKNGRHTIFPVSDDVQWVGLEEDISGTTGGTTNFVYDNNPNNDLNIPALRKPFGFSNRPTNGYQDPFLMPWCEVNALSSDGTDKLMAYTMPRADLSDCSRGGDIKSDWDVTKNYSRSYGRWAINPGYFSYGFSTRIEDMSIGAKRVSQIFAKFYDLFNYIGGSGYIKQSNTALQTDYTLKDSSGDFTNPTPPVVLSLDENDCVNNKCVEGSEGITIISEGIVKSSGTIEVTSQPAKVIMKFFAYADKDKMPIRGVKINWDDGSIPLEMKGMYRNARGLAGSSGICDLTTKKCKVDGIERSNSSCNIDEDCRYLDKCAPENEAPNFGLIDNRTCDSVYWRFDHSYDCDESSSNYTNNCPSDAIDGGCCVFKPKVQILDNWGWCNGKCPGDPGGDGCYNGYDRRTLSGRDECNDLNSAYTSFSGKILVPVTQ